MKNIRDGSIRTSSEAHSLSQTTRFLKPSEGNKCVLKFNWKVLLFPALMSCILIKEPEGRVLLVCWRSYRTQAALMKVLLGLLPLARLRYASGCEAWRGLLKILNFSFLWIYSESHINSGPENEISCNPIPTHAFPCFYSLSQAERSGAFYCRN